MNRLNNNLYYQVKINNYKIRLKSKKSVMSNYKINLIKT